MNNEPVGYFGKDPYGNWEELNEKHGIPLYTHPLNTCKHGVDDGACKECYMEVTHLVKELNDGGEPVKNATYWKRQCNLLQSSLTNLQSSLYHANEQIKYLESRQVDPRKTNPT